VSLGQDPDRELLEQWLTGDPVEVERSFASLYDKYQARIFSLGLRITGDHGAASDVVQDTFVAAYEKVDSFRGQALFSSWLTRIGINFALERRRRDSRTVGLPRKRGHDPENDAADLPELVDPRDRSPDRALIDREEKAGVQEVIRRLPPRYMTVILLRYVEEMAYEEVARVLDCSVGTVKSRLNRAHKMLEGMLAGLSERKEPETETENE
jgi:RNA polymerase sigma-70 factor (ECF subfamily)